MPQVLPEPVLQVDDLSVLYVFFIFKQERDQGPVCVVEVVIGCLDRTRIELDPIHLPGAGLSRLAEIPEHQGALVSRHEVGVLVRILFEYFSQVARRTLQQHEEEKVLGETDSSVTVRVDLLQDGRLVLLEILVLILEVRCVVVGRHRMQKVFVRHSELALFCLLAGEDFERLLGWTEKSNLVLVVSADFLCPRCVEALADGAILLLLRHVKRKGKRSEQKHRRAVLLVLLPMVVTGGLLWHDALAAVNRLHGPQCRVESLDALPCAKSVGEKKALSAPLHPEGHHYYFWTRFN